MTAMFFVALSSLSPPGTWCLHYYSVAEGVPHVNVAVEEGAQATVIGRSLEAARKTAAGGSVCCENSKARAKKQ